MASEIIESLQDDLYQKTRSQLNTFLDETNALLAAGDALHEDRTAQARMKLKEFLSGSTPLTPEYAYAEVEPVLTRAVAQTKAYVKTHPWAAVGAAAGIGLVTSLLLKRRG